MSPKSRRHGWARCKPYPVITLSDRQLAWAVGLYEGEGYCRLARLGYASQSSLGLSMTDADVVDQFAQLMGGYLFRRSPRDLSHKPSFEASLRGKRALDAATLFTPHLGKRRRRQVKALLESAVTGAVLDHPFGYDVERTGAKRDELDWYWLAGLLEGEGCFLLAADSTSRHEIKLSMCDRDVVRRASTIMGTGSFHRIQPRVEHYQAQYRCAVTCRRARDCMRKILPVMGARRAAKIELVLTAYERWGRKLSQWDATAIREMYGKGEMTQKEVGREFGVADSTVCRLVNNVDYLVPINSPITPLERIA